MADVTLAECDGQLWLVGGEAHLDTLLMGELPPGLVVELVPCATRAALFELWRRLTPDTEGAGQPWALNPLLRARVLGTVGLGAGVVRFTPWSAMMDQAGQDAIAAAAAWLDAHPAGRLVLRQADAGATPGLADLQRLRAQLVQAALGRAGADAARIREEAGTLDAEHLELVTEPGPS